jgi:ABC-type Mn2+/Zn2+ transport system permease subunit
MDASLLRALIAAIALGSACAVLSVVVVLRRWAFIGEGISHSGFAGAGMVWLGALWFPQLDHPAAPYAGIVIACLLTAIGIAYFSRSGGLNADAAIGIFLVASVAFGFLAQSVYTTVRRQAPAGWDNFLLGNLLNLATPYTVATVALCAGILGIVTLLNKEILIYCHDPVAAEVSGVRAGSIHYLLIVLVALAIIVGVRIAGPLLVPAMLILPGVIATTMTSRLRSVLLISIGSGLIGAVGGLIISASFRTVPPGPAIVLVLFALFLMSFALKTVQGRRPKI